MHSVWEVPQKVKKTSSENLGFVIFVPHSHTELGVWNSSPDPADPADPPDRVSSTTTWDLPSTRAGGQDDVSSKNSLKTAVLIENAGASPPHPVIF